MAPGQLATNPMQGPGQGMAPNPSFIPTQPGSMVPMNNQGPGGMVPVGQNSSGMNNNNNNNNASPLLGMKQQQAPMSGERR